MAKYSFEQKKKIVQAYLDGKGGYKYLAKQYNIPNDEQVRTWVKAYNEFGDDGLIRSRQKQKYSFQFKLHMVELYLSSEVSYQELALSQGINNPPMISKWVNDYRKSGPDALRPKQKGRKKALDMKVIKNKSTQKDKKEATDTNAEYLKQLEDENLKLRIENAFLKELRRLRLEEEALLKEQRELSTVSEEISN